MELMEMINSLLAEYTKSNASLFNADAIKLINLSAYEYGQVVLAYVNSRLEMDLKAEKSEIIVRNQDFTLYHKVMADANYKNMLANMIAAHGIIYSFGSYKPMADSTTKFTVYSRGFSNLLNDGNICTLAEYFDKKLSTVNSKKQTR